jgi:hypothetical protein
MDYDYEGRTGCAEKEEKEKKFDNNQNEARRGVWGRQRKEY